MNADRFTSRGLTRSRFWRGIRGGSGHGFWLLLAGLFALGACGGGGGSEAGNGSGEAVEIPGEEPMEEHQFTNRLVHEKSPYLLQHAHNPVDWYPWGPEALERSRKEDKPIFLSIGYSTCHWCHVMEHESFENEEIAAFLNEHFIPVKVDREERPDLDNLYMTAVQAMTGSGGWPMSVFLTPELEPFFAGTYFPPEDKYGRPGFMSLLQNISQAWVDNRASIDTQADKVAEFLKSQSTQSGTPASADQLSREFLDLAYQAVENSYDPNLGGFGGAPKFPSPHKITFLLRYAARSGNQKALEMVRGTLDGMASGGIHDHLGGGFHRYSTDAQWLVPHFEKMLYDQAGLVLAYGNAWQVLGDESYAVVARGILDYVLRDLTNPGGGFYSAEDADSEGEEGTFYVWTPAEVDSLLGGVGEEFRGIYDVTDRGNFEAKNILHLSRFSTETHRKWEEQRRVLFDHREGRIRPHRDEKIIVAWNGFMIEAMARMGAAMEEPRYVEAAVRAASFIEKNLWKNGRLLRHHRGEAADVLAYLDDYAYLGRGLLALYEATFDAHWLEESVRVAREMNRLFERVDGGFQITGSDGEVLLAPVVETYDGAMPSGNSVAAMFLLRLGHLTADHSLKERGWNVLTTFYEAMGQNPNAHLEMLSAVDFAVGPNTEIVIAGAETDPSVAEMIRTLRDRYMPNAVMAFRPEEDIKRIVTLVPYLEAQSAIGGRPTAYVCRDYACKLPVHDADGLVSQLDEE